MRRERRAVQRAVVFILCTASNAIVGVGSASGAEAAAAYRPEAFRDHVHSLVERFCIECHGAQDPEAGLTLTDLSAALGTPAEIAVWRQILERLEGVQMPPIEAAQPTAVARGQALAWIKGALRARGERVDELKSLAAARGNLVDHAALFGDAVVGAGSTTERVWRVSQRAYDEFFRELDGRFQLGLGKSTEAVKCPWGTPPSWDFGDYSSAHRLSEAEMGQHVANCTRVARAIRGKHALPALDAAAAAGGAVTPAAAEAAVGETFETLLRVRPPADELARHVGFLQRQLAKREPAVGAELFIVAVLCHPEMLYRVERPGAGGRAMQPPRQLARSLALALTDREPDAALLEAAEAGRLGTPDDVRREVQRMLADRDLPKPRILQFFRDYFGYTGAASTFKCSTEVSRTHLVNLPDCGQGNTALVRDTDALVGWVVDADRQVLRTLLTTPKIFLFVAQTSGMREERQRKEAERQRDAEKAARDGKPFDANAEKYKVSFGFLSDTNAGRALRLIYGMMPQDEWLAAFGPRIDSRRGQFPAPSLLRLTAEDFPDTVPHDPPPGQRMGMLTQPAWLQTQSATSENHPIHRGRWIREKLLGGFIPAVPITVDATLPDEPHHTLRERMRVTRDAYCWQCHRLMDPLGLPFEQFDHLGVFRTAEMVAKPKGPGSKGNTDWQTLPLDTSGHLEGSGDPTLDGPVADPFELITKLAASRKVEQVFVRHVFRYFLGRNETLADGPALRAAHAAYADSDGSLRALLESLLTSEPFLYRAAAAAADGDGRGSRPAGGP